MHHNTLRIVHHHVFKCAGSTVMWILERNFPGAVLCVEGSSASSRITCAQVLPHVAGNHYQAVSSHVLAIPALGQNIADIHFSMLREPVEKRTRGVKEEEGSSIIVAVKEGSSIIVAVIASPQTLSFML